MLYEWEDNFRDPGSISVEHFVGEPSGMIVMELTEGMSQAQHILEPEAARRVRDALTRAIVTARSKHGK